jgi:hypothetical protein
MWLYRYYVDIFLGSRRDRTPRPHQQGPQMKSSDTLFFFFFFFFFKGLLMMARGTERIEANGNNIYTVEGVHIHKKRKRLFKM